MVLKLPISGETECRLRRLADAAGKDLTAYVAEIVQRAAGRGRKLSIVSSEKLIQRSIKVLR
ncbi:MAG TPA: hypothetical protein VMD30_00635 [Tepidisphaeraceae bacterium]|nr:hypothetical protein [Tepidisphaeraceae bacterium]